MSNNSRYKDSYKLNDPRLRNDNEKYKKVDSYYGGATKSDVQYYQRRQSPKRQSPKQRQSPPRKKQSPTPKRRQSPARKQQSPKRRQSPARKQQSPKKRQSPKKQQTKEEDLNEYRKTNFKTVDNYVKSTESRQDKISQDKEEIKGKFQGFILIPKDEYKCMQPGAFIRYLKDGKLYRSGGTLKLNRAPDYWILESTDGKKIRWSVPLQNTKNIYYQRDMDEVRRTKKNKDKLYKAVMSHEYAILSQTEIKKFEMLKKLAREGLLQTNDNATNGSDTNGSDTNGGGDSESSYLYTDEESDESVKVDLKFQKK